MKKIILSLSFLLLMQGISLSMPGLPGGDSHDTLLLDGEDFIIHGFYDKSYLGCEIRVKDAHCFKGNVLVQKIYTGCGSEDNDTVWEVNKEVELKAGDLLQSHSQVNSSCKNGYVEIEIIIKGPDGSKVTIPLKMGHGGGGAGMTLPDIYQFCYNLRSKKSVPEDKVELQEGKVFINMDKNAQKIFDDAEKVMQDIKKSINIDVQDFHVFTFNTPRTITSHNNTQFSIEIKVDGNDTMDVIKVYEGSVTVQLANAPETSTDKNNEIEQAGQDLQNGKITMDEFTRKIKEFTNAVKESSEMSKPVTVTEGNKCTATRSTLKVEPIEAGDDHWWEHLK